MTEHAGLVWKKSSFSGSDQNQQCVEVAALDDGGRALRDSKNPAGPVLRFAAGEWDAFVKGARAGEFS